MIIRSNNMINRMVLCLELGHKLKHTTIGRESQTSQLQRIFYKIERRPYLGFQAQRGIRPTQAHNTQTEDHQTR